ncbi:hypothetical protein niasHS_005480 [Heterodera schachtii]|uniref:Peptidase A1 domain-containing protein n=1 Tax=Heterodera schachtii TaxID=97005 RepID=A0ABD2JIY8_HETSC
MRLFLLCVFLWWPTYSVCLVHRLPITVTGSLRTRLLHSGKWLEEVDRFTALDAEDDSEEYYYRGFYLANITVGTPPQQLQVALDTCYPFFWVIDCRCTDQNCHYAKDWEYEKHCFNASKSTSLHGNGDKITIPCHNCMDDIEAAEPWQKERNKGYFHREHLQIKPLHFDNQGILLVDFIEHQWANFPLDGVLGLAWPYSMILGHKPPLMNMLDQLDQPVFTIWSDWRRPDELGGPGGFMTIGGPDNDHCSGPWHNVPLISRWNRWTFRVDGFQIGNYRTYRPYTAAVDTGTALIGGPVHLMQMIIAATNADYCEEDNLYTVPCDQRPKLAPIVLKVNGKDIVVPAEEYVVDLNLPDGKCALGLFGQYGAGFTTDWVLGALFLNAYCTMFDYDKGQVSFASSKDTIPYRDGEEFNASLHVHPRQILLHEPKGEL